MNIFRVEIIRSRFTVICLNITRCNYMGQSFKWNITRIIVQSLHVKPTKKIHARAQTCPFFCGKCWTAWVRQHIRVNIACNIYITRSFVLIRQHIRVNIACNTYLTRSSVLTQHGYFLSVILHSLFSIKLTLEKYLLLYS